MTIDEIKEMLESHLAHWKRLLADGICNEQEGKKTIEAFQAAIRSLEAWDKVINTLKNWADARISPKQRDICFDCIELIEQTIKWEVTDDECLD